MKTDYFYYVIENEDKKTGRTIATAEKISGCNNLKYAFVPFDGCEIISITATKTLKQAEQIAKFWNNCAKEKDNFIFD